MDKSETDKKIQKMLEKHLSVMDSSTMHDMMKSMIDKKRKKDMVMMEGE